MECEERDKDLLMMGHGELAWPDRLRLTAHLLRCPRCRERRDRFAMVSAALAKGIHDPAPGPPARLRRPERPDVPWLGLFALLLLLGALGWMTLQTVHLLFGTQHAAQSAPDANCRPDLPNDRCR